MTRLKTVVNRASAEFRDNGRGQAIAQISPQDAEPT